MNSSLRNLIAMMGLVSPEKQTAKDRREIKRKVNSKPPRSMTPVEQEHYEIYKNLSRLNS